MSQISIWPLRKTWLSTWWKNPYWPLQRSDVSCSWPHISGGILSHSSLQILSESLRFRGWQLATRTFHSLDRLSMGLRSRDWLDHSKTLMCFFLSHSFVALAVCLGSLSCWNTHPRPILNALALTVHGPAHRPFDVVQLSCPFSRKAPPKQNVSTSMFNGGDGDLGVIDSIPPPPNTASWVDAKELNFWSQLLANFRRACTCVFLSRGTLRELQDFSLSRHSVLPIVFLLTMVPAALRSLTRSSSVVLGWFRSHDTWNSMRWDLAWSPSPREIELFCVSSICE